jgi:hypothetical protein
MLNASYSPSLWEVSSGAFRWPETTKPWVIATALVNAGESHAHLQTMCAASGLEMASSLSAADYLLMSIQCFVIDAGQWRMCQVTEVLVGTLGNTAAAVFRDEQGGEFCPDAPDVPTNQIAGLVSVGRVARQSVAPRSPPTASAGMQLYGAIVRQRCGSSASPPVVANASTSANEGRPPTGRASGSPSSDESTLSTVARHLIDGIDRRQTMKTVRDGHRPSKGTR